MDLPSYALNSRFGRQKIVKRDRSKEMQPNWTSSTAVALNPH